MAKTCKILKQEATGVKDEVRPAYNSSVRIGTLFNDIIDKLFEVEEILLAVKNN